MLILALDTSSSAGSLAILRNEEVLGVGSLRAEEPHSSSLFLSLDSLLRELCLSLHSFDLFAVIAGPGSFTGLRVGLTAVKGLAEVYNKPIAAISALEAIAVQSQSSASVLAPVLDARRGQIYFAFYRRVGNPVAFDGLELGGEEFLATQEEFYAALQSRAENSDLAIVTPDAAMISSAASRSEMSRAPLLRTSIEQVSPVLAPFVGQLGHRRALRGQLADALTLGANYIRRCDAELHGKGSQGS
ncbi:MAG: tRNA (adenosine(37)-N6)-threonylcarbamoyltransferase complex dimerization subunit type 1 TsaB [Candidatus Acidiferrales bacterium]